MPRSLMGTDLFVVGALGEVADADMGRGGTKRRPTCTARGLHSYVYTRGINKEVTSCNRPWTHPQACKPLTGVRGRSVGRLHQPLIQ